MSTKQKTLFSFFAKKPETPNSAKKSSLTSSKKTTSATKNKVISNNKNSTNKTPQKESQNTATSNNNNNKSTKKTWKDVEMGTRVSVFWPDDKTYYPATVTATSSSTKNKKKESMFTLKYDDGEIETIDLAQEDFRFVTDNDNKDVVMSDDHQEGDDDELEKTLPRAKRRRIQEDSEEEFEFEDDDDDDQSMDDDDVSEGSEFVANDDEDDDEDEDDANSMIIDDDEDDDEIITQRNKKKNKSANTKKKSTPRFQVREVKEPVSSKTPSKNQNRNFLSAPKTVTPKTTKTNKTNAFASLSATSSSNKAQFTDNSVTPSPRAISQTPTSSSYAPHNSRTPCSSQTATTALLSPDKVQAYVHGAVNPAGAHVHNHLKFLQNPKDAQGRPTTHPDYDGKTIKVDYRELERHGKITPATQQWWQIKAQYFDTVLLFKTGKFYEMFQMDADVGVNVLGFNYMKGHVAHAGFPEIGYGNFAERLVNAGYKVARVEQTETPDQLKERKKKIKKSRGPTPQVVNREVCSIMTSGTRTFCYMDSTKGLIEEMKQQQFGSTIAAANSKYGPLLVIRETLVQEEASSSSPNNEDDEVRPVCEYGITLVDAVRATVTIGQFADDILRSRMNTLLTTYCPSEILVEGGEQGGASSTLLSLLKSFQTQFGTKVEKINTKESFPKSTAIDGTVRRRMERTSPTIHPWDVMETLAELHRRGYYPRASQKKEQGQGGSTSRWPKVLQVAIEGGAELAMSSFGAALFYLQRNLIDKDILGMGIVKAYIPPASASTTSNTTTNSKETTNTCDEMAKAVREQQRQEDGLVDEAAAAAATAASADTTSTPAEFAAMDTSSDEDTIDHMALDGTTLQNLEILTNSHTHTVAGSLWSKINFTKSPHGARLLRAWLLRPLFRKADIERRADAVEEMVSGAAAMGISEARGVLSKCGDIERLLSRIHSMGGGGNTGSSDTNGDDGRYHPNERAVLYESKTHTKRKVGDFSKVLHGLKHATQIPELFSGVDIQSGLLTKIVRSTEDGGCFPNMTESIDWFFDNFDCDKAAQGLFEPSRGMDQSYDDACDTIERIMRELEDYKDEMCNDGLKPRHQARSSWKYINTKEDSKDKYLIELPVSVQVPDEFLVKGKRGKGAKQVNKYRTPFVEDRIIELEQAIAVQKEGKAKGMQLVFAKFDSMRHLWAAAAQATAMLDALGSLAQTATKPGFTRPTIAECPSDSMPNIRVMQGRHPCVDVTHSGGEFIPNDLSLGEEGDGKDASRVLLLSGPNMGGKSTLLRQTCLISILAQIGCYVPANECVITPVDRIYTRLGACDRILLGQSTFFVELAETAAALRGATRRSLVIMDELGRGTSTFDGTAIASATVKHLVERNKCLALFATHYHSLLNDWKDEQDVRLGHMECVVESNDEPDDSTDENTDETSKDNDHNITFLYTLGEGACPKSFGINVARLAALPAEVLSKAKTVSSNFENEMNGHGNTGVKVTASNASSYAEKIRSVLESGDVVQVEKLWKELQSSN